MMGQALLYRLFPDVDRSSPERVNRYAALEMLPDYRKGKHWVYALGFSNGLVKVGRSRAPRSRIRSHVRNAGDAVEWIHVFCGWREASLAGCVEDRSCAELRKLCTATYGREWFEGIGKAALFAVVREAEARFRPLAEDKRKALERARAQRLRLAAQKRALRKRIEVAA